jgi:hypothetical protein
MEISIDEAAQSELGYNSLERPSSLCCYYIRMGWSSLLPFWAPIRRSYRRPGLSSATQQVQAPAAEDHR